MSGVGEYLPDATEGITCVEELPKAKVVYRSRNLRRRPCPHCGHSAYRHRKCRRALHDVGDFVSGRPRDIQLSYSQHHCSCCRRTFNADMSDLRPPAATTPIVSSVWPCDWWWKTACLIEPPVGICGAIIAYSFPLPRSRTGLKPGGKKAQPRIAGDYLDWALDGYSGYVAADELYDGPYCVLSLVDNRTFKRIAFEVLEHDPTQVDIVAFFRRFQAALSARELSLRGITTDGSPLYPGPISQVFSDVPHQVCEFHVIKELTKCVLRAAARVRKELAAQKPKLSRGRPSSQAARRAAPASSESPTSRMTCSIIDIFSSNTISPRPNEERSCAFPGDSLCCVIFARSWMKSSACLIDVAVPTRPWPSWLGCAGGYVPFNGLARRLTNCSLRIRKRRSPSWTTNCYLQPPTQWSVEIVDIAKCKRERLSCASCAATACSDRLGHAPRITNYPTT